MNILDVALWEWGLCVFCIYVGAPVNYMCMLGHLHVCVHVCRSQRSKSSISLLYSPPYFFEIGLLTHQFS